MLLAIDVGNSQIKFGFFSNGRLKSHFSIPSTNTVSSHDLINAVQPNLKGTIDSILISSVVPQLEASFHEFAREEVGVEARFVNSKDDYGFSKIDYIPLSSIGVDRLVASSAAMKKHGAPCIVCDLGTATTIDIVDDSLVFRGGVILPGPATMAEALYMKASKLPRISVGKPKMLIGTSTSSSIQAGVFYGSLGAVEGILTRMIEELKQRPLIVATGGAARMISETCTLIDVIDETLILDGLNLI